MIPAALFGILAASRLGAMHAVVFGGFAPASLAQRIEASKPRAILTASCGVEGAKGALGYKSFIEGALEKSSFKAGKVIIWQRDELRWDPVMKDKGERDWQRLVKSAKNRGLKADAVPVRSSDGIYVIYTSGEFRQLDELDLKTWVRGSLATYKHLHMVSSMALFEAASLLEVCKANGTLS